MRNMSFALTTDQFLDGSKDVTRRMGWEFLKATDRFQAIRKGQGLKKGEQVERLGVCVVLSARRERLDAITEDDVRREGFPGMSPDRFVMKFCENHAGCTPATVITRIEFLNPHTKTKE